MIFACPSVPNNGHHVMRFRIFPDYEDNSPYDDKSAYHARTVISGHFHEAEIPMWRDIVKEYRTIIPLRHPARSLLSYQKRGKNYETWFGQWVAMIMMDELFKDPLYINIDRPAIRDTQAFIIREAMGIDDPFIDWTVNEQSGSKYGTHDAEITPDLMKWVPDQFVDYYESKAIEVFKASARKTA